MIVKTSLKVCRGYSMEEREDRNAVKQPVCRRRDAQRGGCGRKNDVHRHYDGNGLREMFMGS